ncbi:DUF2075 domain-containing protein [Lacticaseibacillus zhaodongensis]|uniref:DUF2075 domain-containing protein n=1 Tax=Lacticaseibacillus zhaodongensis TaxID=2668065 RepID=UPI0012D2B5E6|nr:DUF2075 domain-containing protein [Lacticaseibacillus zhaodongensis]
MAEEYPVIREVDYSDKGLASLERIADQHSHTLLLDFPTVYIIGAQAQRDLLIYVGETTSIQRRTVQHLEDDPHKQEGWAAIDKGQNGRMIVIGHEHFNKSMTLDIENQMMLYLSGAESSHRLMNLRTNPQGSYYPMQEKDDIFGKIWRKLHRMHPDVFPLERIIRDSALFKASPFHKLTPSQFRARDEILLRVQKALRNNDQGQLILVQGEAGSGKTVLLSSLFYQLLTTIDRAGNVRESVPTGERMAAKLMVNHEQQLKVYKQIMTKLGLYTKGGDQVGKPTHFINELPADGDPIDVALVDEAHLLYTQGKQAYRGKNQLLDLLGRARVVITVIDPHQVLATNGYRSKQSYQKLLERAATHGSIVTLQQQLRMQADPATLRWIDEFVLARKIDQLPGHDTKGFDLRVFDSPLAMQNAIRAKAQDESQGLSRMLATFDWPFVEKRHPDGDTSKMWQVSVGDWSMPWNLQLSPANRAEARRNRGLAWAEQAQTINEIGSTFTVQGMDLNYAGVVLGPSVGFEHGRVVSRPENSANHNATQKRSLNGEKKSVATELLRNEVNVLMTRGVHGLYIYAVDPALRRALKNAAASAVQNVAEEPQDYE